jgi:hypothetical protein
MPTNTGIIQSIAVRVWEQTFAGPRCPSGGSVRVIACIEDQNIIDRILARLRREEQDTPTPPLLNPPARAPPGTMSLFVGSEPAFSELNQQGRH